MLTCLRKLSRTSNSSSVVLGWFQWRNTMPRLDGTCPEDRQDGSRAEWPLKPDILRPLRSENWGPKG